ncbi:hypothetical protein DM860_004047 [Cuscuta australis]|uniref:Peptidase M16 C-terminal domain-containing protein n=1 Tax=Cuscuta australis TaxID=267555 RepID=A0A328CV89_9ASTE|nr:hypothetical protein DM860_004047 [Cuscuta australis]
MEECREDRNADGRIEDAHWVLMMEGSKGCRMLFGNGFEISSYYPSIRRLPIRVEKVIKTVSPQIVKHFYEKWYQLQNMAVIAVGDFPDIQSVVDLIKTHFGYKASPPDLPPLPYYPVPLHEETRFSCFVEPEADGSAVMISCKMPADELKTVKDYRDLLAESMFFPALNQRYFKISCKKDPPYFSCYGEVHCLVHPVSAYIMTSSCKEKGTLEALESMLTEGTTAWVL